jgi:hypothetical protein
VINSNRKSLDPAESRKNILDKKNNPEFILKNRLLLELIT